MCSKGSAQSSQRHSALQAVEPNRESSVVRGDPQANPSGNAPRLAALLPRLDLLSVDSDRSDLLPVGIPLREAAHAGESKRL